MADNQSDESEISVYFIYFFVCIVLKIESLPKIKELLKNSTSSVEEIKSILKRLLLFVCSSLNIILSIINYYIYFIILRKR
jgi:hypothetical protein